jgi:hypothetical protein
VGMLYAELSIFSEIMIAIELSGIYVEEKCSNLKFIASDTG